MYSKDKAGHLAAVGNITYHYLQSISTLVTNGVLGEHKYFGDDRIVSFKVYYKCIKTELAFMDNKLNIQGIYLHKTSENKFSSLSGYTREQI